MGLVRRISPLALIVTLSVIGMPFPVHAGEESPPLTFNGRPLSQLLNRAAPGDPFRLAGLLEQETGQISGVTVDGEGQPLAHRTVQLKGFVRVGPRLRAQVVGTDTTNLLGQFRFAGLAAGEYFVELLIGDDIALSAPITLTEGAMQVRGVSVSYEGGMSTAAKVAIYAGLAAAVTIFGYALVCTRDDPC